MPDRDRPRRDPGRESAFVRIPLRFFDLLRGPLEAGGIDYLKFRSLLEVRLVLDTRRGRKDRGRRTGGVLGKGLIATCGMNLILGLMLSAVLINFRRAPGIGVALTIAIVMTVTTLILVVDFSPTLLDTTDVRIVGSAPVDGSTLYTARIAHMVVYLTLVVGSLALCPAILGCLAFPPLAFLPVFLVSTMMSAIWCLSISFGIFVLAIRLFDLEKLQNTLLYVQIAATVVLIGGYQFLPPLMMRTDLSQRVASHQWISFILPPLHYGALLEAALGDLSKSNIALSVLAVVLPLVALALTIYLARGHFGEGLAALARGGNSGSERIRRRFPVRNRLVRTDAGRAGYDFFAALSRRERQFRLRVYPALVLAPVLGVFLALQGGRIRNPAVLCAAIYMLGVFGTTIVLQSRFSENSDASWLLLTSPLVRPGKFVAGAMTALLTTLLLPVLVVVTALVLAIGGPGVLPDAVLAIASVLVLVLASVLVLGRELPFAREPPRNPAEGNIGIIYLFMLITGILILVHFLVRMSAVTLYGYIAVLLVVLAVEIRAVAHLVPSLPDELVPPGGRRGRDPSL